MRIWEKIQFSAGICVGGGRAYTELQVKLCGLSARHTRRLLLALFGITRCPLKFRFRG